MKNSTVNNWVRETECSRGLVGIQTGTFLEGNYLYKSFNKIYTIIESMGMSLNKLPDTMKDKEAWCAAVHGITNSWTRLSSWTTRISASRLVRLVPGRAGGWGPGSSAHLWRRGPGLGRILLFLRGSPVGNEPGAPAAATPLLMLPIAGVVSSPLRFCSLHCTPDILFLKTHLCPNLFFVGNPNLESSFPIFFFCLHSLQKIDCTL